MIKGIYTAAGAMLAEMVRQDVRAHNLANVDTTGFKRCLARVIAADDVNSEPRITGEIDQSMGGFKSTNAPLDVALQTPGYFVLNTPNGQQYTRNGHFSLNADKVLVNTQGFPVMGQNGQIVLNGGRIEIGQDGSIFSDGTRVDSFLVVDYPAMTGLTPEAGSAVAGSVAPVPVANYALAQGGLETSNVNAVTEMTAMTSGYRIYEANAKAVSQMDNSISQLIRATTE